MTTQLETLQYAQPEQHGQFGYFGLRESVAVAGAAPQLHQPLPDVSGDDGQSGGLSRRDMTRVGERHRLDDGEALQHRPEACRDAGVDDLSQQGLKRLGLLVGGTGDDLLPSAAGEFQAETGASRPVLADEGEQLPYLVGGQKPTTTGPVQKGVDEIRCGVPLLAVPAAEAGRIAGPEDGGRGRHGGRLRRPLARRQ